MITNPKKLLPTTHLAAIGAVAAIWSLIESAMETAILGLYEIDLGRGLVLTSNLSFHSRMSLLRILAGEGAIDNSTLSEEMTKILSRLDTAFADRNAIVHGMWGKTDQPGLVKRMSIRARGKKLLTKSEEFSADALWKVATKLCDLLNDFSKLCVQLRIKERLDAAPRHSSARK